MRGWSKEGTKGKEIGGFRDLEIWQRGIVLVKDVYKETQYFPPQPLIGGPR